jgi:transaldolase
MDISQMGIGRVGQIVTIFRNYGFASKVIISRIHPPIRLPEASLIAADVPRIPYKVIERGGQHPLTNIGIEKSSADWKKVPKKQKKGLF